MKPAAADGAVSTCDCASLAGRPEGVEAELRGLEILVSLPPVEASSGASPEFHTQHMSPSSSPLLQPSPSESCLQVLSLQLPTVPPQRLPPP